MAKKTTEELSTEELRARVAGFGKVRLTVAGIFGLIILGWIVGGYWRDNLPVFIATVAMAISTFAMMGATQGPMIEELKRREQVEGSEPKGESGEEGPQEEA